MNSLAMADEGDTGCCSPAKPTGPSYPTLCLRDEQVKAFLDGTRIEPDKEYTATIHFKMEGWRDSDYGKTLDLKVLAAEDVAESDSDVEDAADAAEPGDAAEDADPIAKAAYA